MDKLVKTPSGASAVCPKCGTIYDLHGVDIEDSTPPVGDGCEYCEDSHLVDRHDYFPFE